MNNTFTLDVPLDTPLNDRTQRVILDLDDHHSPEVEVELRDRERREALGRVQSMTDIYLSSLTPGEAAKIRVNLESTAFQWLLAEMVRQEKMISNKAGKIEGMKCAADHAWIAGSPLAEQRILELIEFTKGQ